MTQPATARHRRRHRVEGHSDCQAANSKPLNLGRYFGAINCLIALAAGAWALILKNSDHNSWDYALSVSASGFAAAVVLLLAAVALINWAACLLRWRYLWALPSDIRLPLDYVVPAAVVAGIIAGWFVWQ